MLRIEESCLYNSDVVVIWGIRILICSIRIGSLNRIIIISSRSNIIVTIISYIYICIRICLVILNLIAIIIFALIVIIDGIVIRFCI